MLHVVNETTYHVVLYTDHALPV